MSGMAQNKPSQGLGRLIEERQPKRHKAELQRELSARVMSQQGSGQLLSEKIGRTLGVIDVGTRASLTRRVVPPQTCLG